MLPQHKAVGFLAEKTIKVRFLYASPEIMKDKLTIPEKIHVGFQTRTDTYTGKLAYVIYTDDKGVLRKEKSWNNWKSKDIPAQEFKNDPVEGFVLNKKVGETRWGWNPRKAWVRVYDPRDFEFEISVANLLFILEECSSLKGKGLEGEFVYAWDGTELLLLPVNSQEYKDSVSFQEMLQNKITKDDIKEGYCYINKKKEELLYLGRLPYWSFHREKDKVVFKSQKKHIFSYLNKKGGYYYNDYFVQPGFTSIIAQIGNDPSPQFPEEFEKFKASPYGSGPVKLITDSKENYYYKFIKQNDNFYFISLHDRWRWYGSKYKTEYIKASKPIVLTPGKSIIIPTTGTEIIEDIPNKDIYYLSFENESGNLISFG